MQLGNLEQNAAKIREEYEAATQNDKKGIKKFRLLKWLTLILGIVIWFPNIGILMLLFGNLGVVVGIFSVPIVMIVLLRVFSKQLRQHQQTCCEVEKYYNREMAGKIYPTVYYSVLFENGFALGDKEDALNAKRNFLRYFARKQGTTHYIAYTENEIEGGSFYHDTMLGACNGYLSFLDSRPFAGTIYSFRFREPINELMYIINKNSDAYFTKCYLLEKMEQFALNSRALNRKFKAYCTGNAEQTYQSLSAGIVKDMEMILQSQPVTAIVIDEDIITIFIDEIDMQCYDKYVKVDYTIERMINMARAQAQPLVERLEKISVLGR